MGSAGMTTVALFVLIGCGLMGIAPAREVTHEELRNGMLSLIASYNLLDNKLERHETRERSVGEFMKRAFQQLQKGQKVLEPINGIFTRLDERVSQIETMLMAQEERHNMQSEKLVEALDQIFKWMQENDECFNSKKTTKSEIETFPVPEVKAVPLTTPYDNSELIDQVTKLSKEVQDLAETSKQLSNQTDKLAKLKLISADEILSKMNETFTNVVFTQDNNVFEENIAKQLKEISVNLQNVNKEVPKLSEMLTEMDKAFIQGISNNTVNAIEDMKIDILTATDKVLSRTTSRIEETRDNLGASINDIIKAIAETSETAEKFYTDVNSTYSGLHDKLDVFDKFNKVLLVNSEYVLDTQRKVEFGTHQVVQKIGDILKELNTELNNGIQKRFDDVDSSIVNNHLEALQNLSSIIESEIGHVWKQIEIMHSEISNSKDALNKLQGQTEVYVNGTVTTMDGMEGKVAQITGRMAEVDSNLNYLLGRLSLVTQEFNQIKSGLGNALDQIRSSFQTVQDRLSPGPGPHNIPQAEYETEVNLLSKRNA